jgi:hypothetical protein
MTMTARNMRSKGNGLRPCYAQDKTQVPQG